MPSSKPISAYIDSNGCHICYSHAPNNKGYPKVVRNNRTVAVHKLLWEAVNGPVPRNKLLRHTCDNRRCCNPEHLLIGTHQDNTDDRVRRNRSAVGERNGQSKLTPQIVLEIRTSDESAGAMAKRLGLAVSTVCRARNQQSWRV